MAVDTEEFIERGLVKIEGAFPRETAQECLDILWREADVDPARPETWTRPVIRLGGYGQEPFRRAANTPALHAAFDALTGAGRWAALGGLGTFPLRFPHPDPPGDDGWHIEGSYTPEGAPAWPYYVNVHSRDRLLLLLFLFSEVSEADAPTRVRVGSHLEVPRFLAPTGEEGLDFMQAAGSGILEATRHLPEALVTGSPGDVFLCHPFLVHAAQPHRGTVPRVMAQPPLSPAEQISLHRPDGAYSPVEQAILRGLPPQTPEP